MHGFSDFLIACFWVIIFSSRPPPSFSSKQYVVRSGPFIVQIERYINSACGQLWNRLAQIGFVRVIYEYSVRSIAGGRSKYCRNCFGWRSKGACTPCFFRRVIT